MKQNVYPLCRHGHERTPENVTKRGDCKECKRISDKKWSLSNPGRAAEKTKRWIEANPERAAKNQRKYYTDNLEKVRGNSRKYREANPERVAEIGKKYREKNHEKLAEGKRKWATANPEKIAKSGKKHREANPEKEADRSKKYSAANPEKRRLRVHAYRARKREVGGRLSADLPDKLLALQKGKCRICRGKISDKKYHLDHIHPISKGGPNVDSNIQILCPKCNWQKNAKLPEVYAQELGVLFF